VAAKCVPLMHCSTVPEACEHGKGGGASAPALLLHAPGLSSNTARHRRRRRVGGATDARAFVPAIVGRCCAGRQASVASEGG